MNLPCDKSVRCDLGQSVAQGFDSPLANFSSEKPDQEIFVAINYGWDNNAAPLGVIYQTPGCVSWCLSDVSQDEADLCAARQQIQCLTGINADPSPNTDGSSDPNLAPTTTGPGTPNPDPPANQQLYSNSLQQCSLICPDGTKVTETVGPGEVIARSQMLANEIAHTTACNRLHARAICFLSLNAFACADPFSENPEYSFQFTATSANPPITWSSSGSLPPGISLSTTGLLSGHPTQAGNYSFTVTATNAAGFSSSRNCTFEVLGVIVFSPSLPNAPVDNFYRYQLQSGGGTIRTYSITDGSPPPGITLDPNTGVLSGTPTTLVGAIFTVSVQDEFFNECGVQLTLSVTGPKITCPGPALVCVAYVGDVTAVPAGCTFSGTPPAGLTMNSSGHITGTPKTVAPFLITAKDPSGNVNTKLCNFITNPGQPDSIQDMGLWTPTHTNHGSGSANISGTAGTLEADYVWGSFGAACAWSNSTESALSPVLRNCGPSYTARIKIDWTLPDNPCPSDNTHHPYGTIKVWQLPSVVLTITVGALGAGGFPNSGSSFIDMTIPANSSGNQFTVDATINGGGTLTANVTFTPPTPP